MADPHSTSTSFAVHLKIDHYSIGEEIEAGRRYLRGSKLASYDDAILLRMDDSLLLAQNRVSDVLAQRGVVDLQKVPLGYWPKGEGPGTAAGPMHVEWDGAVIPVHAVNWEAIRMHLKESRKPLTAWFFVLPLQTAARRPVFGDLPPYEAVNAT